LNALHALGIQGSSKQFSEFAESNPNDFDVICAFQILEHMASARDVLEPVSRCAKRGASIFITVPNRHRYRSDEVQSLDCPPHHTSRWDARQFATIAELHGLELKDTYYEEPDFSHVEEFTFDDVLHRLRPLVGLTAARLGARVHRRYINTPRRYARRAERHFYTHRGRFGHTMLAELRAR